MAAFFEFDSESSGLFKEGIVDLDWAEALLRQILGAPSTPITELQRQIFLETLRLAYRHGRLDAIEQYSERFLSQNLDSQ